MNYMDVPLGKSIPFLFDTFAGETGASVTMSGFAIADIKVFKDGLTAKATTNGLTLLGAGMDAAGVGIHGFAVDTNNSTGDTGYWAVGSYYNVVIDAITIDTQTVRFVAGAFRLRPTETQAGHQRVDSAYVGGAVPETAATIATATQVQMDTSSTDLNAILAALTVINTDTANIAAIKSKTDNLPAAPAAVGSAMALTVSERDAIANAYLNLVDGIVTGISPRRALRLLLAVSAGKVTVAGTTVTIRNILDAGTPGVTSDIVATTDTSGQRTAVSIAGIT